MGRLSSFASGGAEHEDVPPEPGTAPIPEGHVRLFHYSPTENLPSIREHGLRQSAGKGETYGEPNQVWAAAGVPKADMFQHKNFVEFHADPHKDLDIGRASPGIKYEGGSPAAHLERHQSHVTMRGDVPPENIVAVHEPWHQHLRYLEGNADYYKEHPSFLDHTGDPDVDKAIGIFKDRRG
jgi:hypothetical protein